MIEKLMGDDGAEMQKKTINHAFKNIFIFRMERSNNLIFNNNDYYYYTFVI